jgi:hypothetical protein
VGHVSTVAKFRKRPIVIEAMPWPIAGSYADAVDIRQWVRENGGEARTNHAGLFIVTLEGDMEVLPGDWVIRGIKGEFYPCKPDIFEATYEPVDDGAS